MAIIIIFSVYYLHTFFIQIVCKGTIFSAYMQHLEQNKRVKMHAVELWACWSLLSRHPCECHALVTLLNYAAKILQIPGMYNTLSKKKWEQTIVHSHPPDGLPIDFLHNCVVFSG